MPCMCIYLLWVTGTHISPTSASHLLAARPRKDRRAPAAGRTPVTPPLPTGPGKGWPRRPAAAPMAAARRSPTTGDCGGASPSPCWPPPPPPNADANSFEPLFPSDEPKLCRFGGSAAATGVAAISPPARGGSVIPEGILTSARWDRSDRRRSKEGQNASFHSSIRPSRPRDTDDDGSFRFGFPKVAFHVSRRDDWRLSESLY